MTFFFQSDNRTNRAMSTEFCSPYCEHMIFNGSCLCQQLYYDRERERIARAKKEEEKKNNL